MISSAFIHFRSLQCNMWSYFQFQNHLFWTVRWTANVYINLEPWCYSTIHILEGALSCTHHNSHCVFLMDWIYVTHGTHVVQVTNVLPINLCTHGCVLKWSVGWRIVDTLLSLGSRKRLSHWPKIWPKKQWCCDQLNQLKWSTLIPTLHVHVYHPAATRPN